MLQDEARRRRWLARAFAFRETVRQRGEVEAAVGRDVRAQLQAVEHYGGEGPRPAQHAGELEIDEQVPEVRDRPVVGFGQLELPQLELEEQRVELDLADARLTFEVRRDVFRNRALDVARQGEEAEQEIERDERADRDQQPRSREPLERFTAYALKNARQRPLPMKSYLGSGRKDLSLFCDVPYLS